MQILPIWIVLITCFHGELYMSRFNANNLLGDKTHVGSHI